MSKKAASATESISLRDKIREAYIDQILTHNHAPASVYAFAKQMGISEADFYTEFNTFEAIEHGIWTDFFSETTHRLESDEQYKNYGSREKLLAFYYTWIEVLKKHRSYVTYALKPRSIMAKAPYQALKKPFIAFVQQIVNEGYEGGEVQNRPFISDKYADVLWVQATFVLNFWVKDSSPAFEQTDVAIEKAVHLSFDLMGRNALDSAFDFAKFLIQRK